MISVAKRKGIAMKSTHDILVEDLEQMDSALDRLSERRDIWQNDLIWWLCKCVRDLLLIVVKRKDSKCVRICRV